ncbi:MAG TPA: amidohydrolase family protein, partial [Steroidobacteraceae bacterium]
MRSAIRFAVILVAALTAHGAQGRSATLILLNGKIWTENPAQPEAQALAIEGNQILAVGSSAAIRTLAGPDCKLIDLGGRRVVPGFNDSHVHLISGGDALISVRLEDANSLDEFRRRLGDYARSLHRGVWIRNGNWDHQRWSPADLPTHEAIDAVTPDNPVFVWRYDGH